MFDNHFSQHFESEINLVAIGGGNGLSTLLRGLKHFVGKADDELAIKQLSAIVAVTDDGGSSGRLRDELQMLPPGDVRNCMVALSEDSTLLSKLFRHRFGGDGNLNGHSFGNLFLAALTEISGGDFVEAVRHAAEVLAIKGKIFPATDCDVRLIAKMADGSEVRGESNITAAHSVIEKLRLEPENCLPLPEAIEAIKTADIITLGPGSLFTSLLPPLLVEGVAEAIGDSRAAKIFVCNLMTQPGETDNFNAAQHLEKIKEYAPEIDFDCIVVNSRRISKRQTAIYAAEGARQIGLGDSLSPILRGRHVNLVRADLLEEREKVRHDAEKLARVVLNCAFELKTASVAV